MSTRAAYGCGSSPAIVRVTNLNDSGSGSLRDALLRSGPRVVIFEISGTISLGSDIVVTTPCLTIAGQTAPSPGIQIRGFGIQIYTHDVLMQHMRIRPGDGPPYQEQTAGHDAAIIYTPDAYNVVFDHNSFSWSQGKATIAGSLGQNGGVTYWRNIMSEALYHGANVIVDPASPSSLGMLIKQSYVGWNANVSVLGNLFAHNSDRNPEIQGPVNVHFINNVVYDWGKDYQNYQWATFIYCENVETGPTVNVMGNAYIAGPPPSPFTPLVAIGSYNLPSSAKIYMNDNAVDARRQAVDLYANYGGYDPRVSQPAVSMSGISVRPSSGVESFVLANAGARPTDRDPVDRRVVSEVQGRSGGVISSQDQVGGWPSLAVNSRALSLPANPHAVQASGYTALEEWLHGQASGVEGSADVALARPAIVTGLRLF